MIKKVATRVREQIFKDLEEKCYVCGKRIGKKHRQYVGQNKWRHLFCEIGSKNWKESKHSKKSKLKELYA